MAAAAIQKQVRRLRIAGVAVNLPDGLVDVAVDRDKIEPPVEIDIEERASEAETVARCLADAGVHGDIGVHAGLGLAVERHHFVVEVRDGDAFHAGVIEIGGVDSHSGARLAVLAESHAGAQSDILKRAVALIAIELVGWVSLATRMSGQPS
jgi:hypothetical protein